MSLLSVIVPTLNEAENVEVLVARLEAVLGEIDWEVIFVDDDSEDGTADLVRRISVDKPYVRVVQRLGRRGLSSACIEGMMASSAPYLAVMDGDLQHNEGILPRMLEKLRSENLDLVVGSRNVEDGNMGALTGHRRLLSDFGRFLSRMICRCEIQDPMSGFFVLDRRFLDDSVRRTSATGFKILVDLISSASRPVRLAEVPYRFGKREHGESKLESTVLVDYLFLIADKLGWRSHSFSLRSVCVCRARGDAASCRHFGHLVSWARRGISCRPSDGDVGGHDPQLSVEQLAYVS